MFRNETLKCLLSPVQDTPAWSSADKLLVLFLSVGVQTREEGGDDVLQTLGAQDRVNITLSVLRRGRHHFLCFAKAASQPGQIKDAIIMEILRRMSC